MKSLVCKPVAESVLARVKKESELFAIKENRMPGLAVILVGNNSASETYVKQKGIKAEEMGFVHFQYNLDEDCEESEVLNLIDKLNHDNSIDGILVQLPLPKHIDEKRIINAITPDKDVDGFTEINTGRLCIGEDCIVPCTPAGIMEILSYYKIDTKGKRAVVIGRSNIVGKPMAMLLMQKGIDCTVTICHSKTEDLKEYTLNADIIVVATGSRHTLDSSFVKSGATVIDVGVNRVPDNKKKSGFHLEGDCDYSTFENMDVNITPVPGGVGVMTVAMLMANTLKLAKMRVKI